MPQSLQRNPVPDLYQRVIPHGSRCMSHSHSGESISLESDKVSKIQLQYHSLPNKQNMTIKDVTAKAKSDVFPCGHSNITAASSSVRISHDFPRITRDFSSRTRTSSLEITCLVVITKYPTLALSSQMLLCSPFTHYYHFYVSLYKKVSFACLNTLTLVL